MGNIFNFNRFLQLTRWTMACDRPYLRRTFWQLVSFLAIFVLIPNVAYLLGSKPDRSMEISTVAVTTMLMFVVVLGSSYMFLSFVDRKDSLRELLMIPASNLEKFLMRYSLYLLCNFLFCIVAVVFADAMQYLVGMVIGREGMKLIIPIVFENITGFPATLGEALPGFLLLCLWLHTFYLLGANLFRNHKYSWVLTTLVLFLLFAASTIMLPAGIGSAYLNGYQYGQMARANLRMYYIEINFCLVVLSIVNIVVAYRLFCRNQLVGRFINKL